MTCEERKELIALLACGALDGAERESLEGHLAQGCPLCAGSLAEAEAVVRTLPLALHPEQPPAHVRERLLARAAAGPRAAPASVPRSDRRRWLAPALAAAAAAAVTAVAILVPAREEQRTSAVELAERDDRIRQLEEQQLDTREAESLLSAPSVALYVLSGTETQPGAAARVFWDRDGRRARLIASRLAPPPAGRTYELWLIESGADGKKIPAGTFDVDAEGRGSLDLQIPEGTGTIAVLAVTDEPAGGSPQPTGSIHLAGNV